MILHSLTVNIDPVPMPIPPIWIQPPPPVEYYEYVEYPQYDLMIGPPMYIAPTDPPPGMYLMYQFCPKMAKLGKCKFLHC